MIGGVDLFCGLGGLTHGLVNGGIKVLAGVDFDPDCRFPYEQNNKARFIEADVRTITRDDLGALWKGCDRTLLAGCAPCQPFSTYSRKARKRQRDTKWDLLVDFGRLVRETSPDFVTMENVPQLVDHHVFKDFIAALWNYHVWWRVVECAEYGVPQTRKRLVLLASKHGEVALAPPTHIDERSATPTVRNAIAILPSLQAGRSDPNDSIHAACSLSDLNRRRIRASKPGGTWRDWDKSLVAKCHRRSSGETYPSVYGRMEWDAPSPTITTQCFGYGNGRFGHPEQHRAISLREAAILQTFPRSYQFVPDGQPVKFSVIGRLIGNAVPVRIGEVIAKALVNHAARLDPSRRSLGTKN